MDAIGQPELREDRRDAFTGYLFGSAAVVAGILTIAVLVVRAPRLGLVLLAGLIAVVATSVWTAGLTVDGVVEFAIAFGGALAAEVPNLAVAAVVVATTLVWAAIAISVLRGTPGGQGFEAWLVRHRRILTILAALDPSPMGPRVPRMDAADRRTSCARRGRPSFRAPSRRAFSASRRRRCS